MALPGDPLDGLEHAVLARLGQGDRHALAAGAADAADAVHVGLRRRRDVVVDDVGELVDVEAARGDVGGDEQLGGAGPSRAITRSRCSWLMPPCSASAR